MVITKLLLSLLLVWFSSQQPSASTNVASNYRINYPVSVGYINSLNSWYSTGILQSTGVPGYAVEPIGYNIFLYAFYICGTGGVDVLVYWQNAINYGLPASFGTTISQVQQSILKLYHSRNIVLGMSAFGGTQNPTSQGINALTCAKSVSSYALLNNYDLIDADYEDSAAFQRGTAQEWLTTYQNSISQSLPMHLITHAPQGPYFINNVAQYPKGAYLYLNKVIGNKIDLYLVQFYNQGSTTYDTYNLLFVAAGGYFKGTAVFQMVKNGIPANKIVVGKPATARDLTNTGLVSASDLQKFFNQAYDDAHWYAGLMVWQYFNDASSIFANTVLSGLRTRCARDLNCF